MASSGNFCTLNPLAKSPNTTVTLGNLYLPSVAYPSNILGTMGVSSGKWYFEARCTNNYGAYDSFGIIASDEYTYKDQVSNGITNAINWSQLDSIRIQGAETTATPSFYNGNTKIVGCAFDLDNNKVYFHGDNTYLNSHNPSTGSGGFSIPSDMQGKHFLPLLGTNAVGAPAIRRANFGQDSSFGGDATAQGNSDGNGHGDFYYAPPTGFLALCSANLPISDDIDPAQTDDDYPQKQFGIITYTGNNTARSITGLGMAPDVVWVKARNQSASHQIYDSSRGGTKQLYPSSNGAEATYSYLIQSFDSDGFSIGPLDNDMNTSGKNYVAWCWRANGGTTSSNSSGDITSTVQANTKSGFSIVTYTGNGSSAQSIGHGLSSGAPELIFVKNRSAGDDWAAYHVSTGNAAHLILNTDAAQTTSSAYWGTFTPTTTLFKVGSDHKLNASGENYVAYLWHSVEGYSKFGSYVGNGNANGPFIYTGFRPRLFFVKLRDSAGDWWIHDTARNTYNASTNYVAWNRNDAETYGLDVDFLSDGIKIRTSSGDFNQSGATILFGAWGDVSFKYNNTF